MKYLIFALAIVIFALWAQILIFAIDRNTEQLKIRNEIEALKYLNDQPREENVKPDHSYTL